MDEQAGPGQQADPALEALQAILQGGPHPTASSYRVYNAYIKVSPVGQPRVFADPSVSLAIFKQHHSMAIDANRSTSVGAGRNTLLLPGETSMNTYRIATEMGKKVCTSLVELMNEAADAGYCFDNIDVTNVFIEYDGNVKLSGVQELWGLNDLDFNNHLGVNFLSIGNIIDHGIFDGNPPPDIAHLTNLMRSDQCYEERKFYSTHAGLIPLLTYPSLIKEFHDFCKFVVPKSIFRRVLRRLSHVQGWRSSVRSNTHLKSTLDYQHGYRLPLNTHGQRKLKRDQKDALTDLGYGRTELRQRNLTCDQLDLIDSLKLFTYMRNRPAHRMEAKYRKQVYAARCSELLTRVRFPLWLCEMQHRLHKTGWLKKLKLKPLFFSRGVSRRMELWK